APLTEERDSRGTRSLWFAVGAVIVVAAVVLAVVVSRGGGNHASAATPPTSTTSSSATIAASTQLQIASTTEFLDGGGGINPDRAPDAVDGTAGGWKTATYQTYAAFGRLRPGAGILVDLGSPRTVRSVRVGLLNSGTDLDLRAAPSDAASAPTKSGDFQVVAS